MSGGQAPTRSSLLDGRWRLLFTTRPGSASPIQRAFTGVESFSVFQEIFLSEEDGARVNNVVDFGPSVGYLKVRLSLKFLQMLYFKTFLEGAPVLLLAFHRPSPSRKFKCHFSKNHQPRCLHILCACILFHCNYNSEHHPTMSVE
jgi:PAP_fibrillin